jgi:transposase
LRCLCRCAFRQGYAQADFGEALVVIGGVEQKAYFFALDLPHRYACYVRAYPAADTEACWMIMCMRLRILARCQSVFCDNDRCLVVKIMSPSRACKDMSCRSSDGIRKRPQRYSAMRSNYVIGDRPGCPGKGNDKGKVEGLAGYSRRSFMVPLSGTGNTHVALGIEWPTKRACPPSRLIGLLGNGQFRHCGPVAYLS